MQIPIAQTLEVEQHQGHGFSPQDIHELIKCLPKIIQIHKW